MPAPRDGLRSLPAASSGEQRRRARVVGEGGLDQAAPEAFVEMNRVDAQNLGLKTGDRARVVSRRGAVEMPVVVDGRGKPPQGRAFVPFFDEMKLINVLTLDAMDNISKEPDYKKCAVRIERV